MEHKEFLMEIFYATQDYIQHKKITRDIEAEDKQLEILEQVEKILSKEIGSEAAIMLLTDLTDKRAEAELPYEVANFCAGIKLGYFMSLLLQEKSE